MYIPGRSELLAKRIGHMAGDVRIVLALLRLRVDPAVHQIRLATLVTPPIYGILHVPYQIREFTFQSISAGYDTVYHDDRTTGG